MWWWASYLCLWGSCSAASDLPGSELGRSRLATMTALHHLEPESSLSKYLINPHSCLLVFTHYCVERVLEAGKGISVGPAIARIQHYKACSSARQSYDCNVTTDTLHYDPGLLRFKSRLEIAVSKIKHDMAMTDGIVLEKNKIER